jgi:hypothetical protein
MRLAEIGPGGFVLDKQASRPEQVDETPIAGELLDRLLESGDGAAADAEDVEEIIPERLSLSGFTSFALPFLAEGDGAVANLVP